MVDLKVKTGAGDPNQDAPTVSGRGAEPAVQEAPPPPRPDPIALIRNRLREVVAMRNQRAAELERVIKAELAPMDNTIAELNALLTQAGVPQMAEQAAPSNIGASIPRPRLEPNLVQMPSGPPGSAANLRNIAQNHPLSGQNLLRKRIGGNGSAE